MSVLRYIGLAKDPLSMTLEERVLAAYYDRLSVYAIDKSRVIAIEFQSADPELAARAANAIAEKYLTLQQVAKQDQARSAGRWLSGELDKLRKQGVGGGSQGRGVPRQIEPVRRQPTTPACRTSSSPN